jgi:hypothetical protein
MRPLATKTLLLLLSYSAAFGSASCSLPTHNNIRFNQADVNHTFAASWQDCCDQCLETPDCHAFTWYRGTHGDCYQKSKPQQPIYDTCCVSSVLSGPDPPVPPGPPPPPPPPPPSPPPLPPVPPSQRTWMNKADPPVVRAAKLLQHMNFTEKTMMLHARDSEDDQMGFYIGLVETSTRLGMPWLRLNDGPQGFNDYGKHPGTTTNWPSGLTIAASFDLAMARLWGESMGAEFRGKGANVQLGPGLCVARLPLNGRNFEYMSGEVREYQPSLGSKSLRL